MATITMRSHMEPLSGYAGRMRQGDHFANPFLDMASLAMPDTNQAALEWCEHIFNAQESYRMALERVIAYFLTDIEIGASGGTPKHLGDDERNKWNEYLQNINAIGVVQELDRDRLCYGNGFASLHVPFQRLLVCPRCYSQYPLSEVAKLSTFQFSWDNMEFVATCPNCRTGSGYRGPWKINDRPQASPDRLKVRRWNPKEIHILWDPGSHDSAYLWKIPEDYKRLIRQGRLFHLERVSQATLKAIKNNQLVRFGPDVLYHMKEPTLAGLPNRGWGISRTLTNFRQIWYVQVLRRYNEAIAMDYVVPFRLITPASRSGASGPSSDPLMTIDMGDFMSQVRSMLRRRRRDPAGWHTLGFPVEYQALGGDAQQLAPKELLDQGLDTLLNASGTPVELYRGTLQLQTAPVSLRLFEATWMHLVTDNNAFLRWLVERSSKILTWEAVQARHKRVTHADDMQRHMALLQLMMGGDVSKTTGLRTVGLEFADELRRRAEDARAEQEMQAEIQEEMDQSAFGQQIAKGMPAGGAPPGQPMDPALAGAPAAGGAAPPAAGGAAMGMPPGPVTSLMTNGDLPRTPEDMLATARSLAEELLGLPESQKDSELRMLKQKNEALHSLVTSQLRTIRSSARSQGGAMLMAQQYG